jgi:hypothetical protein
LTNSAIARAVVLIALGAMTLSAFDQSDGRNR